MKYYNLFLLILISAFYLNVTNAQINKKQQQIHALIYDAFAIRNSNIDSSFILINEANNLLKVNPIPSEIAYAHHIHGMLHRLSNHMKIGDSLLNLGLKEYIALNDDMGVSMVNTELGNLYLDHGKLDTALQFFKKALSQKRNLKNDNEGLSIVLNGIATIYDYKGNYKEAMNYYMQSLEYIKKTKLTDMEAICYHNLSILHYNLKNFNEAINYQKKAIAINRLNNNLASESMNYVCLSAFLLETNELDSAEVYGLKSLQLTKKLNDHSGQLYALSSLGDVYKKKNIDKKAMSYFDLFLSNFTENDDPYMKAQVLEKKGTLLLKNKDAKAALPLLEKAYQSYLTTKNNKELRDINLELGECYKALGNGEKSAFHYEQGLAFQDSVFGQEKIQSALDIEAKYQNTQLQLEQKLKENTISTQRNYLVGTSIGIALISLLSYRLFNQRNKQKQLNSQLTQSRDQISLLNSELNHRVKNNLAFMTSLLEMQGRRTPNEEAKEILRESESRLKTLSLVHANLYQNNQNTQINLKHYLFEITNHLSQYFSIPNKDLQINTDFIDHSCDAEDAMRLGLIVNELVTNSVKHAFHEVENPMINISTSKNYDGKVVLEYKDNGPGVVVNTAAGADKNTSLGVKLIGLLREQLGDGYVIA